MCLEDIINKNICVLCTTESACVKFLEYCESNGITYLGGRPCVEEGLRCSRSLAQRDVAFFVTNNGVKVINGRGYFTRMNYDVIYFKDFFKGKKVVSSLKPSDMSIEELLGIA